jgi:hypothetical protein
MAINYNYLSEFGMSRIFHDDTQKIPLQIDNLCLRRAKCGRLYNNINNNIYIYIYNSTYVYIA